MTQKIWYSSGVVQDINLFTLKFLMLYLAEKLKRFGDVGYFDACPLEHFNMSLRDRNMTPFWKGSTFRESLQAANSFWHFLQWDICASLPKPCSKADNRESSDQFNNFSRLPLPIIGQKSKDANTALQSCVLEILRKTPKIYFRTSFMWKKKHNTASFEIRVYPPWSTYNTRVLWYQPWLWTRQFCLCLNTAELLAAISSGRTQLRLFIVVLVRVDYHSFWFAHALFFLCQISRRRRKLEKTDICTIFWGRGACRLHWQRATLSLSEIYKKDEEHHFIDLDSGHSVIAQAGDW